KDRLRSHSSGRSRCLFARIRTEHEHRARQQVHRYVRERIYARLWRYWTHGYQTISGRRLRKGVHRNSDRTGIRRIIRKERRLLVLDFAPLDSRDENEHEGQRIVQCVPELSCHTIRRSDISDGSVKAFLRSKRDLLPLMRVGCWLGTGAFPSFGGIETNKPSHAPNLARKTTAEFPQMTAGVNEHGRRR